MVLPSNTPGPFVPFDTAPGAPVADANGRHLSYSSSSDTGGSNSTTDGYSSATSSGNVEYVSAGYHQGHVQQHGGMPPAQQPYVTHHGHQFSSPPQVNQPSAVPYEHPDIYAAGIPPQFQHHQQIPQPQQQQQQHQHQQSPTSMNTPIPQMLPSDAVPDHGHNNGAAGPEHLHQQQQKQQNSGQQYQRIARFVGPPPVANACTECRARHLKCDAGVPSCGRCLADRRECSYVKSRRGWKGSRRQKVAAAAAAAAAEKEKNQSDNGSDTGGKSSSAPPPPSAAGATCSAYSKIASPRTQASSSPVSQKSNGSGANPLETLRAHYHGSTLFRSPQESQTMIPLTANLMQLYYAYFHSAHPLCLPPQYLAKTLPQHLTIVLPVMRFIASFFASTAPTETFRAEAEAALFSPTSPPPKNGFTVQALTLFAIGLHSDNDQERCAEVKDKAIEMALDLRMNLREFSESSTDNTEGGKVLAECWRRTWWELYFLDGLLAGFHQKDHFKLWSVPCTVPLPCEELDYGRGVIPEPHSLSQFDERYFAAEQIVFSSFAYRIDAVRILGQVLAVGQDSNPEDQMADAADTSLVNWGLHLPDCKKELVGKDRRVDEMLFQAHMVVNASTIYLHRPKSSLASSLVPDDTSCTPESKYSTATKPIALHTAKAIQAANTISKLITLPCPLIKHTPFFTCVITLAAIVHLSACSWLLHGDEGFLAKERIRLGVGALKTLEEVWNVAGCVLMQVKGVAREVFSLQVPEGEQYTGIITEEEVYRYIEEERTLEIVGGEADYHGLPALDWNGEL